MESQQLFSFPRFMMVARFYYPRLKKQIIFLPIVAFVIGLLSIISIIDQMKGTFVIASLLLGACYTFSPLILATRKGTEIETALPATWVEKSVFLIGYCLIGVTILYFGPILIAEAVAHTVIDYSCGDLYNQMKEQGLIYKIGYNITSSLFYLVTCMTAVICSTRHRVLNGILWVILINIIFFIVGVIEGILATVHADDTKDVEKITSIVKDIMDPIFNCLIGGMIFLMIAMILFTVHKIKNRQI